MRITKNNITREINSTKLRYFIEAGWKKEVEEVKVKKESTKK